MRTTIKVIGNQNYYLSIKKNFEENEVRKFLEKINIIYEIKIIFPKIIKGSGTGGIDWVLSQLSNKENWNENWTCSKCKKEFDNLDLTLSREKMDKIDERFPWTCGDCFQKILKNKIFGL